MNGKPYYNHHGTVYQRVEGRQDVLLCAATSGEHAFAIQQALNAIGPLERFARSVVNGHDQATGDDILVVKMGRQALDEAGLPR